MTVFSATNTGGAGTYQGTGVDTTTIALPDFNPMLGTLTAVKLSLSLNVTNSTPVTNGLVAVDPNSGAIIPATLQVTATSTTVLILSVAGAPVVNQSANPSANVFEIGPSAMVPVQTVGAAAGSEVVPTPLVGLFSGSGVAPVSLFSQNVDSLSTLVFPGFPTVGLEKVDPTVVSINGEVDATYIYTPLVTIPEPTYVGVIATVFVATMLARRRF